MFVRNFADFAKRRGFQIEIVHRPALFPSKASANESPKPVSIIENAATLHPLLRYLLTLFSFCLYGSLYCYKIVRASRIEVIHVQDTGYAGLLGLFVSKLTHKPLVLHVHGKLWAKSSSSNYSYYERTFGRLVANNSAKIILVSKSLEFYYNGMGVNSSKMNVVSTGIDLASFQLSANDSAKQNGIQELTVGYVGRLDPIKNVDGLIRGFGQAAAIAQKHLSLVILGDGPDRKRLEELAKTQNVPITFKGFTNNVPNELTKIDVFVLPSFSEGCPLSLLEAMASGKAIIASNLPTIREIVKQNKEAILVNPHDTNMLQKAILELSNDEVLRNKLANNAKERAKLYDNKRVYSKILDVYRTLVC